MPLPTVNLTKLSLIIVFVTILTYVNILPNKLFFDDEELIYRNAFVADLKYFPKYFTTNMVQGAGKTSNMYRPILITSFAVDHLIWGNNPIGYHLTSVLLHLANSVLVMALVYMVFNNFWLGFLAALFFSVHPAYSEAVIYASGRTDPLYVFFGLCSIISFLASVKKNPVNYHMLGVSLILFALSLLSKESAIIIPLLMILCLFVSDKKEDKPGIFRYIYVLPAFLISVLYFILRITILNFSDTLNFYQGIKLTSETALYSGSILVRFFTFTKVFFSYLALLVFPVELSVSRDSTIITGMNFWTLAFFITLVSLFIFAVKKYKTCRIYFFSLFWFMTALLPISGLTPINNIFAEHYLYLPSVAFFVLVSYIIIFLYKSLAHRKYCGVIIVLTALVIFFLSARTLTRTFDWRDAITFYTVSLTQSPGNIPMRHNLAMAYQDEGNIQKAIDEYKFIITHADVYPNTHHNLANAYISVGKYKDAEEEFYKALKIDPNFNFSYYGLAELYQKSGEKDKLNIILEKINSFKNDQNR